MPKGLNAKQEIFAQAVAAGHSASAAYVMAGYCAHAANASRLVKKEHIMSRVEHLRSQRAGVIAESIRKEGVDVARTVAELAKIAFSDLREAFTDQGTLRPPNEWPDSLSAAVSSVKVITRTIAKSEEDGALQVEYITEIKLWNKLGALEKLGRYLHSFVESNESQIGLQLKIETLIRQVVSSASALPINSQQRLQYLASQHSIDPPETSG